MTYNVLSGTLSLYTTTTSTTTTHFYSSNYNDDDVNAINTLTVFLASGRVLDLSGEYHCRDLRSFPWRTLGPTCCANPGKI